MHLFQFAAIAAVMNVNSVEMVGNTASSFDM
jgi:hypothetical protein